MNYLREFEVFKLDKTYSTNDEALSLAVPDKIVVVSAKEQIKGRGRIGRTFESSNGGLYMSIAVPVDKPIPCITQLIGVTVSNAIGKVFGVVTRIKWPNDLIYLGKKLCGILCELRTKGDRQYLIIGIGVNMNNELSESLPEATSLKKILGYTAYIRGLFDEITYDVVDLLSGNVNEDFVMLEYKHMCVNMGKNVRAVFNGRVVEGVATDVSKDGGLILETPEGVCEITYGEAIIKDN